MAENVTTQVETKVRDHFHDDAARFDAIYESKKGPWASFVDNVWRGVVQKRLEVNIAKFEPIEGKKLLDVGCGSGRFCLAYAHKGAAKVVGVDFAPAMIEIADKLAAEQGVGDICEYRVGRFPDVITEEDEKFDGCSGNGFFDYVEEPVSIVKAMKDCTKGRMIMSFPKKYEFRIPIRKVRFWMKGTPLFLYTESQVRDIMAKAGVTDYEIVYLDRDYVVVADV